jgi:hypothetical protein
MLGEKRISLSLANMKRSNNSIWPLIRAGLLTLWPQRSMYMRLIIQNSNILKVGPIVTPVLKNLVICTRFRDSRHFST